MGKNFGSPPFGRVKVTKKIEKKFWSPPQTDAPPPPGKKMIAPLAKDFCKVLGHQLTFI